MINVNVSLFVQLVNFLLLLFILNSILYKPILNSIRQRQGQIQGDRSKAKELEKQIEAEENRHQEELAKARQAAGQEKVGLLAEAKKTEGDILDEARTEAARMVEGMRTSIAGEAEQVRKTLKDQMTPLAQSLAGKLLGRSV